MPQKAMKISIDVDGVLARFDTPFAALLTTLTGKPCEVDEPTCWEWPEQAGFTQEEQASAWRYVADHPDWWGTLPPYDDSFVDFKGLQRGGWDLYFVTARRTPFVKGVTEEWLQRHYRISNPTVITTSHKGLIAKALSMDAHIDDSPEMSLDVKMRSGFTRSYLRVRAHNAHSHDYMQRNNIILIDSVQAMFDRELERISK